VDDIYRVNNNDACMGGRERRYRCGGRYEALLGGGFSGITLQKGWEERYRNPGSAINGRTRDSRRSRKYSGNVKEGLEWWMREGEMS